MKHQPTQGDIAVWEPSDRDPVRGRVVKEGRFTYVDWETGRRERISARYPDPSIRFDPGE